MKHNDQIKYLIFKELNIKFFINYPCLPNSTVLHFVEIFIFATFEYFSFWNFFTTALNFFWLWHSCKSVHIYRKHLSKVSLSGFWSSSKISIFDFTLKIESVRVIAPKTNVVLLKVLYRFAIYASSNKNLHISKLLCDYLVKTDSFLKFFSFCHLSVMASKRLKVVV